MNKGSKELRNEIARMIRYLRSHGYSRYENDSITRYKYDANLLSSNGIDSESISVPNNGGMKVKELKEYLSTIPDDFNIDIDYSGYDDLIFHFTYLKRQSDQQYHAVIKEIYDKENQIQAEKQLQYEKEKKLEAIKNKMLRKETLNDDELMFVFMKF